MATIGHAPRPCAISINVFSGRREPIPAETEILLRLHDGNRREAPLPNNGYYRGATIASPPLPFFDNFGDRYSVVVSAKGHRQTGFYPVRVKPRVPAIVDLLLLRKDASFNSGPASWKTLKKNFPAYERLLAAGAKDRAKAEDRYTQLLENEGPVLACFFNLVTAMSQIHLREGTPIDYMKELIWDDSQQQGMRQDRFFAWVDRKLIDQVAEAASRRQFVKQRASGILHPGGSRSWKQKQLGEANIQLTFHEKQQRMIEGTDCVVVEPDIDYYKDPGAHAILEVAPNLIGKSMTDPRQVYMLRWIAGRHVGLPNFDPPYFLE